MKQNNKQFKFIIISSFEDKDDFGTDPYGYYVELNGKKIVSYGDDYHEKGQARCEGFIQGYLMANNIKEVDSQFMKGSDIYSLEYENRDDFEM